MAAFLRFGYVPGPLSICRDTQWCASALTYLPDDLLTKVDRASLSVALEVRVPFLNHRVVEAGWRLPLDLKLRGTTTKWALRQILYRHVPRALIERPKHGFSVPLAAWLRGPLRGWADDLLSAAGLRRGDWLEPEPIVARRREHRQGRRDWSQSLWTVLMLQTWLRDQGSGVSETAIAYQIGLWFLIPMPDLCLTPWPGPAGSRRPPRPFAWRGRSTRRGGSALLTRR